VRRETSPLLGRRCRVQRAPWVHAQSARVVVLALLFLAASATGALAEAFQGKVVGVADGDTITVLNERRPETIRLNGIDAPEKGQAFGERAKQFTARLAFGQLVQVIVRDRDRYGRTVADVRLPDGRSHEIVRGGYAWWFRRYSSRAPRGGARLGARGRANASERLAGARAEGHATLQRGGDRRCSSVSPARLLTSAARVRAS
jgi:micrococcal nuclease